CPTRPCVIATKLGYRSIVGARRPGTMERIMTKIHALVMSAALAIGMAAPAWAGISDPEVIFYRFPGVYDDGDLTNASVAASFHGTNLTGTRENLRIVVHDALGVLKANFQAPVDHLTTLTLSTHNTRLYSDGTLSTGAVTQGTAAIAATSVNIICTALTLDAASATMSGAALRGIRFSPVPGSQE